MNIQKDEVLKLADENGAEGNRLTNDGAYNIVFTEDTLLDFANSIAKKARDEQREKDAKICESVSFERRNQGNHIGFNAMHECADAIRANKESQKSDEATIYDKINEGRI